MSALRAGKEASKNARASTETTSSPSSTCTVAPAGLAVPVSACGVSTVCGGGATSIEDPRGDKGQRTEDRVAARPSSVLCPLSSGLPGAAADEAVGAVFLDPSLDLPGNREGVRAGEEESEAVMPGRAGRLAQLDEQFVARLAH